MTTGERFVKTERQREACDVLNKHRHSMLFGGGRSTKTSIIVRNIILRAVKKPSRHLITRACFNHVKQSVWHDTFPKMAKGFFPGLQYGQNKQDWYITIPTVCGNESQIWFGGTDSKERTEKILGNEYSTIFANEVSQMDYDTICMLRTRLAENSGLSLRFYYDLNPVGKKHWTYQEFVRKINPEDKSPSKLDTGYLLMNPMDNPHLPPEVIEEYKALPKRKRQRFLEGLFLDDVEGALWSDEMIAHAHAKEYGDLKKVVIAVDPAVSNNPNSDMTGIVACGLDEFNEGVVLADYSKKTSTAKWARIVANAYYEHEANCVVAEVNQGGDLVKDVLKNIDRSIKVVTVHASKGKFARAEPISELYELGHVAHAAEMHDLEDELTQWVPFESSESPNRLDAAVWGLTHLMVKKAKQVHVG